MKPDLFVVPQFFDPRLCETIVAELKTSEGSSATVYGSSAAGSVDERTRKTLRLNPAPETVALVTGRLWTTKEAIEKHFAVTLRECEEPQFLHYRQGDFFVAHQDGNTGMLRLDSEKRLISTVIMLSRESEQPEANRYGGGALVFSDFKDRFRAPVEAGMLIAFRSETTHEVTPVTHGERFSIASWYR